MDNSGNIHSVTFEPVRKLLIAAYKSGDFSSADAVIVRNTVKQAAMVWKLMNGCMDAYCWSSGQAVAHMLSRTSHPGYMLQLTTFVRGHATGDTNIKHAAELRLPDGAVASGVEHAGLGIECELAERFGIYITPDAYEQFGRAGDAPDRSESVQPGSRDAVCEISSRER
ncbi:hypothetical protein [Collinsella aerofaciens]|uniref:hypothetical protein n=1 Tax=Collinsella aerofaciens TaxID=74426 RepID=UPI003D7C0B44